MLAIGFKSTPLLTNNYEHRESFMSDVICYNFTHMSI